MTASWGAEDTAAAIRLWNEGRTASEIAHVLKRSRDSVIGRLYRKGALGSGSKRKITSKRIAKPKPPREARLARRNAYQRRWRASKPKIRIIAREGRLVEPLHIPFMDLDRTSCRFPTIERDGQQFFCGRPREHNTSYCDDCCRVAFTERGYEAVLVREALKRPMNGYVARPFVMPIMGGEVREYPFS